MATLSFENVNKIFPGNVQAVSNFNLNVKDKEFVVLVGPSGCGKTTTLRMIAGLESISSGKIFIDDTVINDIPPKDRDIAMVFQNYALYPHMDVYNNMAFGLKLRKFPKSEIDRRVKEGADILSIRQYLARRPKELSGGQMQRVAVGRAIVRNAKVYLFDEPLSNLDAKLRVDMRAELNRLHNRLQATMIYVTHDQVEAMTLGDRIVIMKDGFMQQCDTPLEIYDKPINKFVASFIGTPAMNFLDGNLIKEDGVIKFVFGNNKIPIHESFNEKMSKFIDKEVFLGIRPEHVYDVKYQKDPSLKEHTIVGTVEVIERLGNEILVYLTIEGQKIILKEDAHYEAEVGQKMEISFNPFRIHSFDKENEQNIILK